MQFIKEVNDVLQQENWQAVNRDLAAKMLSEYMYEDMIQPQEVTRKGRRINYSLTLPENIEYTFQAEKRLFDSYHVFPETIQYKNKNGTEEVKAVQFLLDLAEKLGMTADTTGHLIKEINHTLIADAHIANHSITADEIVEMDYAEIEGEMAGHPWITYNKGRIGFGYDDYLAYAPENKKEVPLSWLAVHKDRITFRGVHGLDHEKVLRHELDSGTLEFFKTVLKDKDVDPEAYFFMPVHEWQWQNVVIPLFSEELAAGAIIPLGKGSDHYLPQQSIRTFANISDREKYHVKVPMSILNTLVYRGLPAERTVIAPNVTQYIQGIRNNDPFLRDECRLITPGEVASINYDHPHYSKLPGAPYQYLEMLGCIWRESIYQYIKEGEHPITLAALLHVDKNGKPVISSLVERSGLSLQEWLSRLFHVTLPPVLHYLYKYGTVFSPHGQNTILVLKDHQPHRLAMKDYVDDVNVSDQPLPELEALPQDLKEVLRSEPPEGLVQFIFTGLFICHFRYLSDLLEIHHGYSERAFWTQVREVI
ncbi:MAG TPA: IucA/IucC family siderophore biosynthesis protein, partial [Bacillales bacterium]